MPGEKFQQPGAADVRHIYLWQNLACTIVSEGLWGFGMGALGMTTVLAAFVTHLGASNLVVGLLPAAFVLGFSILRIPGALLFRPLQARRIPFIAAHVPPIALQFALAYVAGPYAQAKPHAALGWFFMLAAIQSLIFGAVWSVWPHLLDRIFPPARRGWAVGIMSAATSIMAMAGGLYAHAVLNLQPQQPRFDILFWVTGVVNALSLIPWLFAHEKPLPETPPPIGVWRLLRRLLHRGSAWRRLIFARWASELARAPLVFATVLVMERFGLPAAVSGTLTFLMNLGSAAIAPMVGWIGDRLGHKSAMVIAGAMLPFGTLLVLVAPHPWVAFAGFFILGAVPTGDFLGTMNLVIETAPEEDKAIYLAVVETCMVPPRLVGPLAAGAVAQVFSAGAALALAIILQLGSLAVTVAWVEEPRKAPTGMYRRG